MAVAAPTGIIIGPLGRGEVTTRGQLVERHLRDAQYRLYAYDAEDRLIAPVMPIVADNDAAATEQAEQMPRRCSRRFAGRGSLGQTVPKRVSGGEKRQA
jgi:YD repeat-containing protein